MFRLRLFYKRAILWAIFFHTAFQILFSYTASGAPVGPNSTGTCTIGNKTYQFKYQSENRNGLTAIQMLQWANSTSQPCVILYLHEGQTSKEAFLAHLSFEKGCLIPEPTERLPGSGSCFLRFAIEKSKEENASTIELSDASEFVCPDGNRFSLAKALLLISGKTWYESYGFQPIYPRAQQSYSVLKKKLKALSALPPIAITGLFPNMDPSKPLQEALSDFWKNDCRSFGEGLRELWDAYLTSDDGLPVQWKLFLK
jgi:hypothetical protein